MDRHRDPLGSTARVDVGDRQTPRSRCVCTVFPIPRGAGERSRPLLVDAGWRVVAPFMRGYAPSSIPADGSYHVGALMDDALRVLEAAGRPDAMW